MANETMAGGRPHSESDANLDEWVIKLQDRLKEMRMEARGNGTEGPGNGTAIIFRLHHVRTSDEQYYVPRFVSIGPYHCEKPKLANNMEKEKDEAMLRMERRIQRKFTGRSMESIVESEIVPKDKRIRDFYAEEIPYSPTVLAWMVTRDACFIYELLLNFPRCTKVSQRSDEEEKKVAGKHINIFDGSYVNPTLQNLLVDCFLFENQIPGFVLELLVKLQMDSQAGDEIQMDSKASKEKLVKMMDELTKYFWTPPFTWRIVEGCWDASHLLEALYFETLGDSAFCRNEVCSVKHSQVFCLPYNYVSTFSEKYARWMNDIFRHPCMQCSHWMKSFGLGFLLEPSSGEEILPSMTTIPRAVELNKAGVRFHVVSVKEPQKHTENSEKSSSGIMWIRFDPKTSTLYLPKMIVAPYDEYIIRNFIALENSSDRYRYKAMTVFVKFMNELIDNEEDAALLVEKKVIDNVLGSNEQVAKLFNSIAKEYRYIEGFQPIDDVKKGLIIYQKRNYKILWSQFMESYFSKPWLVGISVGTVLLLFLTIVQVFCLFFTCNKSGRAFV